ncbi:hypothetical protein Amsp01_059080 [Amycolatopsis sp. NBRC 101858]|uniref:hypothetical protein n=1 Tax=Amycolatopsis sp. NBRC 101858 TaxID=3032200 RepID=UPI00249FB307|nr:hypothetical protein [Amycolatopsis sp. NBRC 101858]GLY39885.1 hypothetical protein Amsp01_059080 [Amycolatopsis sp. NBRC 101858]
MTEESMEFVELWQKVKALTASLSSAERDLVRASLLVAWILTTKVSELEKGFQGSFTPDQAAVLTQYASGSAPVHVVPHLTSGSIQSVIENSIRSN